MLWDWVDGALSKLAIVILASVLCLLSLSFWVILLGGLFLGV